MFEIALVTVADKVKTYHHPLQVLDIAVQMYPALQLMQAQVLPIKFKDERFCR